MTDSLIKYESVLGGHRGSSTHQPQTYAEGNVHTCGDLISTVVQLLHGVHEVHEFVEELKEERAAGEGTPELNLINHRCLTALLNKRGARVPAPEWAVSNHTLAPTT
jgi:hypothetical protein